MANIASRKLKFETFSQFVCLFALNPYSSVKDVGTSYEQKIVLHATLGKMFGKNWSNQGNLPGTKNADICFGIIFDR